MKDPAGLIPDIAYYGTGELLSRGFTLDGEMHSAWEFFRKDGSVMRTGEFDRGRQVGIWRTFDRAGGLVKETDFSKRRRSGGEVRPGPAPRRG